MTAFPDSLTGSNFSLSGHLLAVPVIIVVTSFMVFGFSGCRKPSGNAEAGQDLNQEGVVVPGPKLSLPIQRTLTDKKGRKVEVTIVKRSPTHITIIRKSDQKSFDLAIAKLSETDRIFAEKLPVSIGSEYSNFVKSRRETIRKLEKEIQLHDNELASGALNGSQTSMANGKIERLRREILDLQNQIATHQR